MGLALIWKPYACNNVQSIANSLGQEILPRRLGMARYPRGVSPHPPAEHQGELAEGARPQVLPALQPSQDGAVHPFQGDKVFYGLKNNQINENPLFGSMEFSLPAAIQPTVPGIEKFYLEVGRKVLFNTIFIVTMFLFLFWVKLKKFLEC